jgi:hypothetical protein
MIEFIYVEVSYPFFSLSSSPLIFFIMSCLLAVDPLIFMINKLLFCSDLLLFVDSPLSLQVPPVLQLLRQSLLSLLQNFNVEFLPIP